MSSGQPHLFFTQDSGGNFANSVMSYFDGSTASAIGNHMGMNSTGTGGSSYINTKENDGTSPYQRQRRLLRIVAWLVLIFMGYQVLVAHFLAGFVPDIEVDKETGQKRVRRRPDRNPKLGPDGKPQKRGPIDGVVEGHHHLIDLDIPSTDALTSTRYNVKGIFCVLEWGPQEKDPASVPLFEDLVERSELCKVTRHTADLYEVAQSAREWDLHMVDSTLNHDNWKREQKRHTPQPAVRPIERSISPTALIFHESRCGSTLVSNILASFEPESTKVYSEAPPPIKALEACVVDNCPTPEAHEQLVRDVFYMMGRTQRGGTFNPEHHVFYKLQPQAVHYMPLLETALSQPVPWMYLYRDNNQVMMSHFKGSVIDPKSEETNLLGQKLGPKCLERYQADGQPAALQKLVAKQGRTMESLSAEEYCAAHLASLSESAIQHYTEAQEHSEGHQKTPHFFINYKQLPDVIWDHVLPSLGVQLRAPDIHRMEKVAALYTQGRPTGSNKQGGSKVFTGDSAHKESNVPWDISEASHQFMDPTYLKLEELAQTTLKAPKKVDKEDDP